MTKKIGAYSRSRAADLFALLVAHGQPEIQRLIDEQVSEELFIDYKRVTNDGQSTRLEQADRENFARAVCGFANAEGGVILWGVDCRHDPQRGDVPSTKHPIHHVKRFLSYLEGASSGCSLPPHDGVEHFAIGISGTTDGFVATYVPKSMFAPHQCIVGKYKNRYYVRVGSNFEMAPHGLLAGMFGRQPVPHIFHLWGYGGKMAPQSWAPLITQRPTATPYVWLKPMITNQGVTVARDVYVNFRLHVPGATCKVELSHRDPDFQFTQSVWGWHLIAPGHYRLPPAGLVEPFAATLYLMPPFEAPLEYEMSYGCEGSPVNRVTSAVPTTTIDEAYNAYLEGDRSKDAGLILAKEVLGLGMDQDYAEAMDE